jgi:hypothetical protein
MRRPMIPMLAAVAALSVACAAQAAPAPAPPAVATVAAAADKPMDAAERRAVIEELAKDLQDYFVFPDVAARYAAMLRANLARGDYDKLTDPTAFGVKVTADLQAVSRDGHLRLAPNAAWELKSDAPAGGGAAQPVGLEETRMIGKVAYLRFSLFPDDPETSARARRFLLDHADAQAVIIDSRTNHGGGLTVMDAILPLLYAKPETLVRMDTRASAAEGGPDFKSLVRQPSPPSVVRFDHHVVPDTTERRLQSVPVYYLTSSRTASAAEHLALAFRHTHRAVQIGETTRGAGHFGGRPPVGARFAAFIPVGRTYDPDTGWDWEGKGVAPDIAVPAGQALAEALKRAKAAGADIGPSTP